jgi:hypothetical protein
MKSRYRPAFNARVYGPAERRADIYWKKRLSSGQRTNQKGSRTVSKRDKPMKKPSNWRVKIYGYTENTNRKTKTFEI